MLYTQRILIMLYTQSVLLCNALYAKCPYYAVLYMQSVLILERFIQAKPGCLVEGPHVCLPSRDQTVPLCGRCVSGLSEVRHHLHTHDFS